jgi:hypothetical protein
MMNRNFWISVGLIALLFYGFYSNAYSQGTYSMTVFLVPYLGLYYAIRLQFKLKIKVEPSYKVTLKESYKIGMQHCLTSMAIVAVIYLLIPDDPSIVFAYTKLVRILGILLGPIVMGSISSILSGLELERAKLTGDVTTISNRWLKTYFIIVGGVLLAVILFAVLFFAKR